MNRLGELIYENDFEYKVYAVSMRDNATTRISLEIYIVSPEDEISDLITIQKRMWRQRKTGRMYSGDWRLVLTGVILIRLS